jgi:hypothetical protein
MIDVLAAGEADQAPKVGKQVVIVDGLNRALHGRAQCLAAGADDGRIASGKALTHWPEELRDEAALAGRRHPPAPEHVVAALGGEGDRLTTLVLEEAGSEDPAAAGRLQHTMSTP